MLVYDITNEKSFDNIRTWIRNIEEVSNDSVHACVLWLRPSLRSEPIVTMMKWGKKDLCSQVLPSSFLSFC